MSAQWVIPGWPETDEYLARRPQKRVHGAEDCGGIGEVLKGVYGDNQVGALFRRRREKAGILNARISRPVSCLLQNVLADIDADHPSGPHSGHFNRLGAFSAAKVDNDFARDPGEELIPHENREL